MTRRYFGNADAFLTVIISLLWLPGRIVEESIHALAAMPWAEVVSVRFEPRVGSAKTLVQYADGTPRWAVGLAYLAPQLVAAIAAVAVIAWWIVGGPIWYPATTLDWVLLSILGAQYLAIALPSAEDADWTPTPSNGGEQRDGR